MKRNSKIDILKGIAILLVVMGHTCFGGTEYIYLFHMAVFFMASGYFFRDNSLILYHLYLLPLRKDYRKYGFLL